MNAGDREKLLAIVHECDVHARRVEYARGECSRLFPLARATCDSLSDEGIAYVDQLIYRYTKLQDALGAKLFPAIVAHDYEDDVETAAGYLNDLYETSAALLAYHSQVTDFARERVLPQVRN